MSDAKLITLIQKLESAVLGIRDTSAFLHGSYKVEDAVDTLRKARKSIVDLFEEIQKPKEQQNLKTGTVKWYNDAKGYGYITLDKEKMDVYVHFTAIQMKGFRSLHENQRVTLNVIDIQQRLEATTVYPN